MKKAVLKISSSFPAGFYAEPLGHNGFQLELGWRVGSLNEGWAFQNTVSGVTGTAICVSETEFWSKTISCENTFSAALRPICVDGWCCAKSLPSFPIGTADHLFIYFWATIPWERGDGQTQIQLDWCLLVHLRQLQKLCFSLCYFWSKAVHVNQILPHDGYICYEVA